jgi:phospholipid/cholesterol/gamma-HCH transport system substrate-binding protein
MKNQKRTELKVGITVIVSILILLWVLGWAKNFSFNSNQKKISVAFNNVAGLLVGDPVSVQGIKSGYVEKIYSKDNSVIVELSLSNSTNLKEDSKFSILMIDLMGGKKVEIYPGVSPNEIDYAKLQHGEFLGDISTAMATLGSVENDLVEVVKEIKVTLKTFNKLASNPDFINELQTGVKNLNALIIKTDKFISTNGKAVSELIKKSNSLVENSNTFIIDNKNNISESIKNISTLIKNTQNLVTKLDGIIEETKTGKNNIGKIIYDEKFFNDLTATIEQLKKLTETFNEQLNNEGLKVDASIF